MSGLEPTDAEKSVRRRRLVFRAWHRGMREMDLIMGRFADARGAGLSDSEVEQFEALMEVPDPEIFKWITGALPTPDLYDTALFRQLRDFHTATGSLHG